MMALSLEAHRIYIVWLMAYLTGTRPWRQIEIEAIFEVDSAALPQSAAAEPVNTVLPLPSPPPGTGPGHRR